ncbi:MAG: molecular chaperone TorD family protein [Nitrospirae bacterium]|nr:molecular chaperone TorD family protein [Nitrospirota bacterium]MBI5096650.1 molecular chaperone TorD family protein [Nitrospirota bacterium]
MVNGKKSEDVAAGFSLHYKSKEGAVYAMLSECFKEPCVEFAEDVATGRLYELIAEGLKRLDIPVLPDVIKGLRGDNLMMGPMEGPVIGKDEAILNIYHRLREAYYSLFFPLYVVPVESVYKAWKEGKDEKGYIMGDPAIEMKKRYGMAGIEIPEIYKDTPDHIFLLLEYASLLCENLEEESRAGFVSGHLDWVEDLRNDIYKYSESHFYRAVADVTVSFLKGERTNLLIQRR